MSDPAAILADIRKLTDKITKMKRRRATTGFKSYGDAQALQHLEKQRAELRGQLPPLSIVN